jgi:aspartyl-tRNA(Asn)/glutamyl-tRNA(Gln) amidotransferase subunit A
MTRTVRDAALMLSTMAGPDDRDPLSFPAAGGDYAYGIETGVRNIRVAWSPTFGYARVAPEVRRVTEAAALRFQEQGCRVELVERVFEDPDPIWAPLFYAGVAARLQDVLPEWRDRIDPGLLEVIEEGKRLSAMAFKKAEFGRAAFYQDVRKLFLTYDLLLSPTLAAVPFAAGMERPLESPGQSRLSWVAFTYPFNLTGQPAATVPCGFTADGLPVGLQIVGARLQDALVLRAAAAFEAAAPWAGSRPAL